MRILFLLFIVVPILEMWVLIEVGSAIGSLYTIALVLATAFIGALLLRREGLRTLIQARGRLASGQLPIDDILSGLLLAVGGALLLTPGFITDTVGFLCLLPLSRNALIAIIKRHWQMQALHGQPTSSFSTQYDAQAGRSVNKSRDNNTIEGEFDRED